MSKVGKCPIWGTKANIESRTEDGRIVVTYSPRAGGGYSISGDAKKTLRGLDEISKVRLTSWLVEQRIRCVKSPDILSKTMDEIKRRPEVRGQDRRANLLRYLYHFFYEKEVEFQGLDKTSFELLAWTSSLTISEVIKIAESCREREWIEYKKD